MKQAALLFAVLAVIAACVVGLMGVIAGKLYDTLTVTYVVRNDTAAVQQFSVLTKNHDNNTYSHHPIRTIAPGEVYREDAGFDLAYCMFIHDADGGMRGMDEETYRFKYLTDGDEYPLSRLVEQASVDGCRPPDDARIVPYR